MTTLVVRQEDGVKKGFLQVEFELGKIYEQKEYSNNILVAPQVDNMENIFKQITYEKAQEEDWDEFVDSLDSYVTYRLNQILGIKQLPLEYVNGEIVGVSKEIKIVFE